ncbi:histidine N-alpha-methyltransferase-like [Ylistrum balloti]|uniref:histidine N-alpha-methyltransferase-like n=1 Tax=Ylistrum balloti TaxID=509963 RepID=UPI002905CDFC|nr:histidine N-alpha-methyltransferase-like [Ylistrum balloti]
MDNSLTRILVNGLTSSPKFIPTWYNYDEVGSELEHKCVMENPGYYFAKSQMSVLRDNIESIIPSVPYELTLVDLGSGNCSKTRLVIDELLKRQHKLKFYPVDISKDFLLKSMKKLSEEYDNEVEITPIAADYVQGIEELGKVVKGPKLILWFGSIINMSYDEQVNTLKMISTVMTNRCALLFSADITQDRPTILAAYNDKEGLEQRFVQHAITRLNNEHGSQIDLKMFTFHVDFISDTSSNRMSYVRNYIQAKRDILSAIPGLGIQLHMKKGERLYFHEGTGFSCKYTLEQLENIVDKAGLCLADTVTDENQHAIFCHCNVV